MYLAPSGPRSFGARAPGSLIGLFCPLPGERQLILQVFAVKTLLRL